MAEHALVVDLVPGGSQQHGEVVVAGRPASLLRGKRQRPRLHAAVDEPDNGVRLGQSRRGEILSGGLLAASVEQVDLSRQAVPRTALSHLLIAGLVVRRSIGHHERENPVHQSDQPGFTAVVAVQGDGPPAARFELLVQRFEHADLSAPEAVDRLLLVTHEKQLVRLQIGGRRYASVQGGELLRQQEQQILLEPVVVLELVDHDVAVSGFVELAQRLVQDQRLHGELRHVLKGDQAQGPLALDEALRKILQQGEDLEEPLFVAQRLRQRGQLLQPRSQLIDQILEPLDILRSPSARFPQADGAELLRGPAVATGFQIGGDFAESGQELPGPFDGDRAGL